MATIYEVAALAGVSPATVSRVLNGVEVSPTYAEKVRRAAETLQFTPNRAARNLRRRSSDVLALVIPDIENPFFTALARGVEDVAQAAGYSVVLCNSDEQQDKQATYLGIALAENMAGILLAPAHGRSDLDAVVARGTPMVMVDRSAPGYETDAVVLENAAGGRRGTELLHEQGYSRVACITGPRDVETARLRIAGWREAFTARSPELDPERYLRHGDYKVDGGRAAMSELLAGPGEPPDAVFVANNLMAVGAWQCLQERGTPPPVVGLSVFGDLPFATLRGVGMTVLPVPAHRLGARAAELLLRRVGGDRGPPRTLVVTGDG